MFVLEIERQTDSDDDRWSRGGRKEQDPTGKHRRNIPHSRPLQKTLCYVHCLVSN